MKRRHFVLTGIGLALGAGLPVLLRERPEPLFDSADALVDLHTQWPSLAPSDSQFPTLDMPLQISKAQWKQQLSPAAYHVMFENATEPEASSPLTEELRAGLFLCAACDLPLFSSAMKYHSGTGWPSFFTAIPHHLEITTDDARLLPRTRYHCARCGSHQGQRFADGPAPTFQRWRNNGVSLSFIAADDVELIIAG